MLRVVYTPRYSDSCRFTLHGGAAEPGAGGEAGDEHESIYFLDLKECRYRQFYRVLYTHYIRSYTTSYVYMSSTSIYITTEERSNVGEPESSAFRTGGSVSRTRRFSRGVIYTLIPCSLIFLFNSRYLYSVLSNPYVLSSQQDRFYHPNNLVSISTPDLVPVSTVPSATHRAAVAFCLPTGRPPFGRVCPSTSSSRLAPFLFYLFDLDLDLDLDFDPHFTFTLPSPQHHTSLQMATHVLTATTTTAAAPQNQISVYGHPSPTNSSTTTPSNNSPTSPRLSNAALHQLPLQSRQLRPPKGPLYVPAALRPTEHPQKTSPITPPRSVHGSLDSLNEDSTEPISRRSTMESKSSGISKVAKHEWMKNESLGEVTGLPTRDHWKVSSSPVRRFLCPL